MQGITPVPGPTEEMLTELLGKPSFAPLWFPATSCKVLLFSKRILFFFLFSATEERTMCCYPSAEARPSHCMGVGSHAVTSPSPAGKYHQPLLAILTFPHNFSFQQCARKWCIKLGPRTVALMGPTLQNEAKPFFLSM